ncbi:MAG: hypothetical protein WD534_08080 [Phycisphaeraceae bacterium]
MLRHRLADEQWTLIADLSPTRPVALLGIPAGVHEPLPFDEVAWVSCPYLHVRKPLVRI